MSDIFLSYANEDLQRVLPLVRALEQHGWSVWWDRTIPPGKTFDETIAEALDAARCVMVVWSKVSVRSDWVKEEAEEGRKRRILLPVMIDEGVSIPMGFRRLQAARLFDWQATVAHGDFDLLIRTVTTQIGPPLRIEASSSSGELSSSAAPPRNASEAMPLRPDAPGRAEVFSPGSLRSVPRRHVMWLAGGGVAVLLAALYFVFLHAKTEVSRPVTPHEAGGQQTPAPTPPKLFTNSFGMEFIQIPAGAFQMGSTNGEADERPVHTVRISQPLYVGKYEVTQGQWQAIMGNNPSQFTGDANLPVENVSWEDVQEFLRRLHARESGTKYRLPTEAEWEYAARAGSTTDYSFGNDKQQLGEYAWFSENAGGKTHPVGQRKPNAWGFYDMHGNVWEWVQDWYGTYDAETATDPSGPPSGSDRVVRGGGWIGGAGGCRSAFRGHGAPGGRYLHLGFRLVRTAP